MKFLIVFTVLITLTISTYGASIDFYAEPTFERANYEGMTVNKNSLDAYKADGELNKDNLKSMTESNEDENIDDDSTSLTLIRARRFTCDVLSFQSKIVSPNHSACAVRCIAQRRKGGSCKNGICVCRGKKWGK